MERLESEWSIQVIAAWDESTDSEDSDDIQLDEILRLSYEGRSILEYADLEATLEELGINGGTELISFFRTRSIFGLGGVCSGESQIRISDFQRTSSSCLLSS